jgi:uncharacterized membrane protein YfcA
MSRCRRILPAAAHCHDHRIGAFVGLILGLTGAGVAPLALRHTPGLPMNSAIVTSLLAVALVSTFAVALGLIVKTAWMVHTWASA